MQENREDSNSVKVIDMSYWNSEYSYIWRGKNGRNFDFMWPGEKIDPNKVFWIYHKKYKDERIILLPSARLLETATSINKEVSKYHSCITLPWCNTEGLDGSGMLEFHIRRKEIIQYQDLEVLADFDGKVHPIHFRKKISTVRDEFSSIQARLIFFDKSQPTQVVRVDDEKRIIYIKKPLIGVAYGKGNKNIKRISGAAGESWRIRAEK